MMDWFVVNQEGKVAVKCNYEPDVNDLNSRGEIAIQSDIGLELWEVEYKDGKIQAKNEEPVN
ncbi:MAG: hypothetical protein ABII88_02885 [Candidatus Omnitrophota bacterium]